MLKKNIQITAGKGPIECSWVVAQVLKNFIEEAKANSFQYSIIHRVAGLENGTVQSVTIQLEGKDLNLFLKDWIGTVLWIGKSTYRKFHKRKNWFIGINELNEGNLLQLDEKDIKFQAIRSSGAGGQNVNKVSSAVRATHESTGMQVLVMDSRSQHQNKKIAIERLKSKVEEYNTEQLKRDIQLKWENHLNLERENPIKIFKGQDFKRQKIAKHYKSKRQELNKDLKKLLWD